MSLCILRRTQPNGKPTEGPEGRGEESLAGIGGAHVKDFAIPYQKRAMAPSLRSSLKQRRNPKNQKIPSLRFPFLGESRLCHVEK